MFTVYPCMCRSRLFFSEPSSECHLCLAVQLQWEMRWTLLGPLTWSPGLLEKIWHARIADFHSRFLELRWETIWFLFFFFFCNIHVTISEENFFFFWKLRGYHQCCSLLIMSVRSSVTGGRGLPHKGASWKWSCHQVLHAHSSLETHCFVSGAGFYQSTEKQHRIGGRRASLLDGPWTKQLPSRFRHLQRTLSVPGWAAHEGEAGVCRSFAMPPWHACYLAVFSRLSLGLSQA